VEFAELENSNMISEFLREQGVVMATKFRIQLATIAINYVLTSVLCTTFGIF